MKNIFFFTGNKNKYSEIKGLLKTTNLKIYTLNNFKNFREPIESGKSFAENAKIKSDFGFIKTNIPCFADDSGICIKALNYKPGIFSKRYLSKFKSNKDCFNKIIYQVEKSGEQSAFFKTSISLTIRLGITVCFEGVVRGKISNKVCGKNGFGYDPIFIPNGYSKTFAEMDIETKNLISHRSIAMKKLVNFLTN